MNEPTTSWLDKAQESLRAAEMLKAGGFFSEAVSRAYYAMFYAAKALTLTAGKDLSKHSAVISAFGHDFVATGRLRPELHQYLREAFDNRNVADYRTTPRPSAEDAAEGIAHAQEFVAAVEEYLRQPGE